MADARLGELPPIFDEPTGDALDYLVITTTQAVIISAADGFLGLYDLDAGSIRSVHVIEPDGRLVEVGLEAVGPDNFHGFEIYLEGDRDAVIERFQLDAKGEVVFDDVFIDGFPTEDEG